MDLKRLGVLCCSLLPLLAWAEAPMLPQASMLPQATPPIQLAARAYVLSDYHTGRILEAVNAHQRVEPASLTKMMTAYIVYAAIHDGRLKPGQVVPVSVKAWRTGGSKMFISPDRPVTVDQLIHGMVIDSGNDACVALAEAVAGSEEAFVGLMNQVAQRLGMKETHFANATGLPDPRHYTTAYDLDLLARALIHDFPQYYHYDSVREYTYNGIRQQNRNLLLNLMPNIADGIKTGFTDGAGYCLVGSAKQGDMRLISVVMGTKSPVARAEESQQLLNYGFRFFETKRILARSQVLAHPRVWKGARKTVPAGVDQDVYITLPRSQAARLRTQVVTQPRIIAPVHRGQQLGVVKASLDGTAWMQYPLKAKEPVAQAGWFGRAWDAVRLMLK